MALNLKKFEITTVKHDSVIVLIGMRNTGKTVLVTDLLKHQPSLSTGTIISGRGDGEQEYSLPNMVIHEEYSPAIISDVLNRQKSIKDSEDPRTALVLDDCLYDYEWIRDENIRELFINRRHNNTLFIITMQYGMGITLALRRNIDYVFILRERNVSNRRRLYDCYADVFPNFETFCHAMSQYTDEFFNCLVIDNTSTSMNWEDKVFWYKADYCPVYAAEPRRLFSVTISKSNVRPSPNETLESEVEEI